MKEFESDVLFSFTLIDGFLDKSKLFTGKLYVSDLDGIYINYTSTANNPLEFFGNLSEKEISLITVYGQTVSGKKFTAYQCHKENSNANLANGSFITKTEDIKVSTLFFGAWIEDIDNIKINSGKVRFSYLEHWLYKFNIDDKYTDKNIESFTIPLEQFDINFNVEVDNNTTIKVSRNWNRNIDKNKKLTFEVQQFLEYSFTNSISLQSYNELNFNLQNFFRLILPDKNIFIEEQYITIEDANIEIYSSNRHYIAESDKISGNNFLYLYDENTINEILLNWFNNQNKYGRIFKVLSSILDNPPFIYVEHKFLNIIHWYEAYGREEYPADEKAITEFENRIKKIVNQIENNDDKQLVQDITKYSYEYPLKKQLKKIFDHIGLKDILSINSSEQKSLIHNIGENRNKLTHTNKDSDFSYLLIGILTEILRDIIFIILIKVLKLDETNHSVTKINDNLKFHYLQYIKAKDEATK